MALIANVSIDLSKIDKSKIQKLDKNGNPYKNGAMYYNVQISVNDDIDKYGNNVKVTDSQTKEERESKVTKNYIGNGKVVWQSVNETQATPQQEKPKESDFQF